MSVLIRGMEMPKTGRYFVAVDNTDGKDKTVISVMSEFERGDKTRPLLAVHEVIPVPPHGDLIGQEWLVDIALHLMNTAKNDDIANGVKWLLQYIIESPTIIPAEEGE